MTPPRPAARWATRWLVPVAELPTRLRRLLACAPARRAALRRAAALTTALALSLWAHGQLEAAAGLRRQWSHSATVIVARHGIGPGEVVAADDLQTQRRPGFLVPEGALRSPPHAPRRAVAAIAAGEPVIGSRLGRGGALAWRVPSGRAAVTLEVQGGAPPVEAGDRVDVLATDGGSSAVTVAGDAVVLEHTGNGEDPGPLGGGSSRSTLTVAVRTSDLAATSAAVLAGPVAVALRAAGG